MNARIFIHLSVEDDGYQLKYTWVKFRSTSSTVYQHTLIINQLIYFAYIQQYWTRELN